MIKVIQWATGAMGRTALRRIIDHPDLTLCGVYVYGAGKSGLDAGAIARRPDTGVVATNDIESILGLEADVVLHMPRITLPYDRLVDDVVRLLESGKNVVSTAGFHWPDAHGPDYADRLRAACRKGGATLAGVGINPGLIVERLALVATGLCVDVTAISVREMADASAMTSPEFVFDLMGFGTDPVERDVRTGPLANLYTTLFSESLYFAAHALGSRILRIEPDHQLTLAPRDIVIGAGTIGAGRVAATEWRWTAHMENGVAFTLAILWTSDPSLHDRAESGHWTIEVQGRPNVTLSMDVSEADPAAPPSRALTDATVAVAIRAIPDVIAAPPGLFAFYPPAPWRQRLAEAPA